MKLSEFEKLSLHRAKRIKKHVASIRPVLQDLQKEYDGIISSGDLSQMISSRRGDYWFEEPPKTNEANTALAYLAYNEVLFLEDDEWNTSPM